MWFLEVKRVLNLLECLVTWSVYQDYSSSKRHDRDPPTELAAATPAQVSLSHRDFLYLKL